MYSKSWNSQGSDVSWKEKGIFFSTVICTLIVYADVRIRWCLFDENFLSTKPITFARFISPSCFHILFFIVSFTVMCEVFESIRHLLVVHMCIRAFG